MIDTDFTCGNYSSSKSVLHSDWNILEIWANKEKVGLETVATVSVQSVFIKIFRAGGGEGGAEEYPGLKDTNWYWISTLHWHRHHLITPQQIKINEEFKIAATAHTGKWLSGQCVKFINLITITSIILAQVFLTSLNHHILPTTEQQEETHDVLCWWFWWNKHCN